MPEKKTVIGKNGVLKKVIRHDPEKRKRDRKERLSRMGQAGDPRLLYYGLIGAAAIGLTALVGWGVAMLVTSEPDRTVHTAPLEEDDVLGKRMLSAEEVAHAFLQESDARERLAYVRDPDAIKQHLASYPEQALNQSPKAVKYMGHSELNGSAVTAYAISFKDGSFRMLSVVQTGSGPKVDWDSYARYCSANWEDLFSGEAKSAEVRVFVRPGDYHAGQFRDRKKWTCFKLETPDSDRSIYAYAAAGSDLSKRMQTSVMKNRSFRQHMTLQIKSVDGSGKDALFVVEELLAMGWLVE